MAMASTNRHLLASVAILLTTASPVHTYTSIPALLPLMNHERALTFASSTFCLRTQNHLLPTLRPRRHPQQRKALLVSKSARHGQNRNNNDGQDEISELFNAFDGIWAFLSRPLRLGSSLPQIPTLYPILLALVAVLTNLITFLWFTGAFVGFAYLGRSLVSQSDDGEEDDNNNSDLDHSNYLVDDESVFVPTDLFALLGAVVTTGLLAPPSTSSPTLSLVPLDASLQPPVPAVVIVLLVLAGLVGFSSSSTPDSRYNRDDAIIQRDYDADADDDLDSADQRLLDLWDEKFDRNRTTTEK